LDDRRFDFLVAVAPYVLLKAAGKGIDGLILHVTDAPTSGNVAS
jgi:hypothetical protein